MGDARSDNSDELQDASIVTPPYHFLMRSLICIMSDIDLMQPRVLGDMMYAEKFKHIMLENGDPLEHDFILFLINNDRHWYMVFIDNRSTHKKFICLDSGSVVKVSTRSETFTKVFKIITYYREYLSMLLVSDNLTMSNLTISADTHYLDNQIKSNIQENSHDCGPFTLMNAEILLRNDNISTLTTGIMPLLRIYITYNLICNLRGTRLRVTN